ncbi:GMC oxidoreductase [Halioxenophilus sp. WMMB6]|uniref:GMC oxidoreductase n=1 Tax=Halioxenophilus sp. WMMB6 TaxID=3073815 RepID=UPI00295E9903|nr:GMC oxidoreductase [Halioxenophilus sp. WMMB6]
MKNINRRNFIKGSAYLGAASAAAGSVAANATMGSLVPTYFSYRKCAVIGSGFGGSVAALRLGLAGKSTALIERGKYWQYQGEDTFPVVADAALNGDGRTTWLGDVDGATGNYPVSRYTGLLERINGDTTHSVVGAGLGGGSLVYGGVLLQPRRDLFEQVFPFINYDQMDSQYYPRVLSLVSGGTIPEDILNTNQYSAIKTFIDNATAAGLTVTRSHVGFNWNVIRKEVTGEINPFASVGEYVYGCNSNAKNTLDKNYINQAAATGKVSIFTLHNVTTVKQTWGDSYEVHCEVLNELGDLLYRHVIYCQYLFMAAGAVNTPKLLLKAKALGDLTGLNDQVGQNWGGNGDELMGRLIYNPAVNPIQGGPPCVAAHDTNNPIKTVGFMHSPSSGGAQGLPDGVRLQLHMAMSVPDALGSVSYNPATNAAFVSYPEAANQLDRQAHYISLAKMQHLDNGVIPGSAIGSSSAIWHPLGGAVMGAATSELGEVYGQSNLFVVDGSLMPGSTAAANPSLTIAANAERIMESLIPQLY